MGKYDWDVSEPKTFATLEDAKKVKPKTPRPAAEDKHRPGLAPEK